MSDVAAVASPRDPTALEAENERLRAENEALRQELGMRVDRERAQRPAPPPSPPSGEPESSDARPVLRLYGRPQPEPFMLDPIPGPPPPLVAQAPPPGAARLPVQPGSARQPERSVPPIPARPVPVAAPPVAARPAAVRPPLAPTPPPSGQEAVARGYRQALADLTARRYERARIGFATFLRDYPRHPYADNAMYWLGEIHFARRDYRRALQLFSAVTSQYPNGNKVPDALLRMGRCHEHLGAPARARDVYRDLRRRFPTSVAARTAPREDV